MSFNTAIIKDILDKNKEQYNITRKQKHDKLVEVFHRCWGDSANNKYNKKDWIYLQMLLNEFDIRV